MEKEHDLLACDYRKMGSYYLRLLAWYILYMGTDNLPMLVDDEKQGCQVPVESPPFPFHDMVDHK